MVALYDRYIALRQRPGIVAPVISVGLATALVYLAYAARELLTAATYGRSDDLDAFLIAFMVPTFAVNAVASSLTPALIPAYIRVRHENGQTEASRLFGAAAGSIIVKLFAISLILCLVTKPAALLLAPGFNDQKLGMVQRAYFWTLPLIVFRGVAKIYTALLNAHNAFGRPAIAPIMLPLGMIAAIITGPSTLGTLLTGAVFGSILEAGFVIWALARQTDLPWPSLSRWTADLRRMMNEYLILLAGSLIMGATVLVNQAMASHLGPGSVASLNYGSQTVIFVQGIVAIAVGSVALPFMSRLAVASEFHKMKTRLLAYSWKLFAVAGFASAVLAIAAVPMVRILYQHGRFTIGDTSEVAQVLRCYSAQIPFFIVNTVFVRLLSVLEANHVLLACSVLNFALNWLGNTWLIPYWGVRGIALSTVFVYAFTSGVTGTAGYVLLERRRRRHAIEGSMEAR